MGFSDGADNRDYIHLCVCCMGFMSKAQGMFVEMLNKIFIPQATGQQT